MTGTTGWPAFYTRAISRAAFRQRAATGTSGVHAP